MDDGLGIMWKKHFWNHKRNNRKLLWLSINFCWRSVSVIVKELDGSLYVFYERLIVESGLRSLAKYKPMKKAYFQDLIILYLYLSKLLYRSLILP